MLCQGVVFCGSLFVALVVLNGVLCQDGHFTPTWAVHIKGGRPVADAVAAEHGFINLGQIVEDYYHFHHNSVRRRSVSPSHHHNKRLSVDHRVHWSKQQKLLTRKKRDFIPIMLTTNPSSGGPQVRSTGGLDGATAQATTSSPNRNDRDLFPPFGQKSQKNSGLSGGDYKFPLNDHRWQQMWYLNRGGGLDMNVIPAWREGITGKGIVVTILDDGLEKDHPDLLLNYDPQASYDVNNHDEDPMPRYDMIDSNRHGTRCAGEVAATANNTLCAVGVAFGASVGGVRMLDGDVTDAVEARSLSLNPQHIDIYSASWGPDDDGKTVDGPGELATRAFIEGVTKGRSGKGSIFVWASGNGGKDYDNCNCDGYTNSIWTLSISSATEKGEVPWYSEMCSSTLATTYSSGSMNEKQVVTTDLHHSCTSSHTGTSASAPLAAGICALALEANRDLTWRDMQHIVVRTAKPANLQSSGWSVNGVGRNVSHSFGYGLMDAAAMVQMARTWRTVPAQRRCEVSAPHIDKSIPPKSQVVLQLAVNQCSGVNYLEHVQAKISLTAGRRGDLQINLTSPAGTRVTLLAPRSHDFSRAGFNSWPFMSVHTWGESPYGIWQLEIHNEGRYMGTLSQWDMIFYGTEVPAQAGHDSVPGYKPDSLEQEGDSSLGAPDEGHHNSIDGGSNARWRDTEKIRDDGRLELQSSPNGEEPTSSGCLSYVPSEPQRCIGLCLFLLLLIYTLNSTSINSTPITASRRSCRRKRNNADSPRRAKSVNDNHYSPTNGIAHIPKERHEELYKELILNRCIKMDNRTLTDVIFFILTNLYRSMYSYNTHTYDLSSINKYYNIIFVACVDLVEDNLRDSRATHNNLSFSRLCVLPKFTDRIIPLVVIIDSNTCFRYTPPSLKDTQRQGTIVLDYCKLDGKQTTNTFNESLHNCKSYSGFG